LKIICQLKQWCQWKFRKRQRSNFGWAWHNVISHWLITFWNNSEHSKWLIDDTRWHWLTLTQIESKLILHTWPWYHHINTTTFTQHRMHQFRTMCRTISDWRGAKFWTATSKSKYNFQNPNCVCSYGDLTTATHDLLNECRIKKTSSESEFWCVIFIFRCNTLNRIHWIARTESGASNQPNMFWK